MSNIFRERRNQPIVWFHRDLKKSNRYCLYCGVDLFSPDITSNKEHLIGREFVPSGSFLKGKEFNFIFRACKGCNDEKGKMDRHISSITLVSSPACNVDPVARDSAVRKANNDFHPSKKGVLIKDSSDSQRLTGQISERINVSIGFTSPPQMNANYACILAFRHIQGLFSLVTSRDPTKESKTRLLPPQQFAVFGIYKESDWGNPQLIELVERSKAYCCYVNINTAKGYFKAILKRDNESGSGWFWALEWNKNYRVIGYIASVNNVPKIFKGLSELSWLNVKESARMRSETSLNPENDNLFSH